MKSLTHFYDKRSHKLQKLCNQKDTNLKIGKQSSLYRDRGPTANQSGEVIKMRHTDIYGYKTYQKYTVASARIGYATHSLYASSGQRAEGVRTNNQRGRRSGLCLL